MPTPAEIQCARRCIEWAQWLLNDRFGEEPYIHYMPARHRLFLDNIALGTRRIVAHSHPIYVALHLSGVRMVRNFPLTADSDEEAEAELKRRRDGRAGEGRCAGGGVRLRVGR